MTWSRNSVVRTWRGLWPRPERRPFTGRWLVRSSSAEILAHRMIFFGVLAPLLGFWLPATMVYVAIEIGLTVLSSVSEANAGYDGTILALAVSAAIPALCLLVGFGREGRRLRKEDVGFQAAQVALPARQGALLKERVERIWQALPNSEGVPPPRIACQPNFGLLAHAYDDESGQTIEVSAGLAANVVQDNPLALSILRHEMAHLVQSDLPVIRLQAMVAGALDLSTKAALAVCAGVALGVVAATDLGKFPQVPTLANILWVHLAILLGTVLIILPLFFGRFIAQRYVGFIVALIEMRADVCAGLWGDGLKTFSERLAGDSSVRATGIRDLGLAYISPTLTHLPAHDRAALMGQPERLSTPKLRYFVISIVAIWFLPFHQGSQGWDAAMLSFVVALLQAITVYMVLTARGHVRIGLGSAAALAFGLTAMQALPLISIEGIVYLAQSMAAALVMPGGFGGEGNSYLDDIRTTFSEFAKFVAKATGSGGFIFAILGGGFALAALSRLPGRSDGRSSWRTPLVVGITSTISIVVSYGFFQKELNWPVRMAAFSMGDGPGASLLFELSEVLNGPPLLGDLPWLRLCLPVLAALLIGILAFGVPRPAKLRALADLPGDVNRR